MYNLKISIDHGKKIQNLMNVEPLYKAVGPGKKIQD